MKKMIIALSIALSFALPTYAFADQAACEAKAVSKEGKPLYGGQKRPPLKNVWAELLQMRVVKLRPLAKMANLFMGLQKQRPSRNVRVGNN